MPWVVSESRANLAAVERVTRLLPSSSSFLGPCVDDTSITDPSITDAIPLLLFDVLPFFLDVTSEVSVDKAPCVRELTSVRVFLLEPTLWAVAGTPVVMLDDDEFTDSEVFARFAGGSTLALDTPEFIVLNEAISLDRKLVISAIVSLMKADWVWIPMHISISAKGSVDTVDGPCWLDWSFCAVLRYGCGVSPVRSEAGGGFRGTTTVFPL